VNAYTTWSGHLYNSISWVVSEKWFQKLPPEYRRIVVEAAREAVQVSHGMAVLAAVKGWEASCKRFKACHVLSAAERERMAALARPAWRKWITEDFGVKPKLVDDLWAEVARVEKDIGERDLQRYGR
jgi:TRAP-type C4-dicarboxylate transport system substrate-binding protein